MNIAKLNLRLTALVFVIVSAAFAQPYTPPLKVLLITGGCCHDYVHQKDILKTGLEKRANISVTQMFCADTDTHPNLACLTDPNYAKGYDLVIHDECGADIKDKSQVGNVLKPHQEGIPGVNLHCAMHSYRVSSAFTKPMQPGSENALWFDYLGLQSSAHGARAPISISFIANASTVTRGMSDWTTIDEELYNNVQPPSNFPNHNSLARGTQLQKQKNGTTKLADYVVVWTNQYGPKKVRVFSTTIGHSNQTVNDPRYLDLVTRGVLWAAGKLDSDGNPYPGYGPR
jgi:type 1 glutamine amidotransferase